MPPKRNNVKTLLKICYFLGFAIVVIGFFLYFFNRPDLSRILILLGAILWIPQKSIDYKDDYIKNRKIDFFWISRFIAVIFIVTLFIVYLIFIR
jgi:hypothetical protein